MATLFRAHQQSCLLRAFDLASYSSIQTIRISLPSIRLAGQFRKLRLFILFIFLLLIIIKTNVTRSIKCVLSETLTKQRSRIRDTFLIGNRVVYFSSSIQYFPLKHIITINSSFIAVLSVRRDCISFSTTALIIITRTRERSDSARNCIIMCVVYRIMRIRNFRRLRPSISSVQFYPYAEHR